MSNGLRLSEASERRDAYEPKSAAGAVLGRWTSGKPAPASGLLNISPAP